VNKNNIIVLFEVKRAPVRANGWALFTAHVNGVSAFNGRLRRVYNSRQEGDTRATIPIPAGSTVVLDCDLAVTADDPCCPVRYGQSYILVAGPDETAEIDHRPEFQGLRLRVRGARIEGTATAGENAPADRWYDTATDNKNVIGTFKGQPEQQWIKVQQPLEPMPGAAPLDEGQLVPAWEDDQ